MNYLITGYHGEPHITAENDRGVQAGIVGKGRFVLPVGNEFRAEYIGNNIVRMYDGKLLDNGAAAGIPAGDFVDLTIAYAGQGMTRNDLIVFQYRRDLYTLVETGEFVVIQGEEAAGSAEDPELEQQDLLSNEADNDQMALWRVVVAGQSISAPVCVFDRSLATANHTHGIITHEGKAGTVSGRILTTGTGGVVQASTAAAARSALGLAPVASSGSYTDLKDKPEIPKIIVADAVTAEGANPVSGKAVIAYAQPLAVLTTEDPGAGASVSYPDRTVIHVHE